MTHKVNHLAWASTLAVAIAFFTGSILLATQPSGAVAVSNLLTATGDKLRVGDALPAEQYALTPFQKIRFLRSGNATLTAQSTVKIDSGMAWLSNLAAGETATLGDSRLAATSHGGAIWLSSKPAASTITAISHPLEITVSPARLAEFVLPPATQAAVTPTFLDQLDIEMDDVVRQQKWLSILRPADLQQAEPRAQQTLDDQAVGQFMVDAADKSKANSLLKLQQEFALLPAAQTRAAQKLAAVQLPKLLDGDTTNLALFDRNTLAKIAPLTRLIITPTLSTENTTQIRQSFAAAAAVQKAAGLPALPSFVAAWQTGKTGADGARLARAAAFGQLLAAEIYSNETLQDYYKALPNTKSEPVELTAALAETLFLSDKFAATKNYTAFSQTLQNFGKLVEASHDILLTNTLLAALTQGNQLLQTVNSAEALHGAAGMDGRIARPETEVRQFIDQLQKMLEAQTPTPPTAENATIEPSAAEIGTAAAASAERPE